MGKKKLWMVIADSARGDIHCAIPTIAWMAKYAGAGIECYLECERDGQLFARSGSTVLGGNHHQQFNYLNAAFDVSYILIGATSVFRSSIDVFGASIIAESDSLMEIYNALIVYAGIPPIRDVICTGPETITCSGKQLEISPYLFPEIYFRNALAFTLDGMRDALRRFPADTISMIFLSAAEQEAITSVRSDAVLIDTAGDGDDYGSSTVRIAERWKHKAKALAFADPPAIRAQLASLCSEDRVAVYGEKRHIEACDIVYSAYTEETTAIADDVIRLAKEIGNNVLVGRQTGDGDLFAWSKAGVCLQIMDPNRPAFPAVTAVRHRWHDADGGMYDNEPDDAALYKYAEEGRILSTLVWHSGEMAHNEAMLALFDLISFTGAKMGFGVHAARYETCPQLWELLAIAKQKGGVRGFAEPLLHSGGMGVLAEVNCPPDILKAHCSNAMDRIRSVAGPYVPKGYYAFMDSDLSTLSHIDTKLYSAVLSAGLEYFISSVTPGRNRIVHRDGDFTVINQSCRVVEPASPFVRITTADDLGTSPHNAPGWVIGTLDAPVIAFAPYVWRHGSRFMQLVDAVKNKYINVLPGTIARYARILSEKGYLPKA
ncbi:MAG: hypothetical protein HZC28_06545 [Spirochaetes bacterium]|nr:hypothetical protein [Spirochaetota bacterium]